ncbi:MAG: DUF86 domain-containing protein [Candidatus Methanoplasma sp.]|nr:DUF86 domain-containing protein [Candidatus Methanoplasma sp.]
MTEEHTDGFNELYHSVEWKNIAKYRDVSAHNYDDVNLHMVWSAAVKEVPLLKKECERILAELKQRKEIERISGRGRISLAVLNSKGRTSGSWEDRSGPLRSTDSS